MVSLGGRHDRLEAYPTMARVRTAWIDLNGGNDSDGTLYVSGFVFNPRSGW